MTCFDICVIGCGASGLMLGSNLKNKNVLMLDSSSTVGQKILISGGGKCNITNENISTDDFIGDKSFMSYPLEKFQTSYMLKLFNSWNVEVVKRESGQYFCKTDSKSILKSLLKQNQNHKIVLNQIVLDVKKIDDTFEIKTKDNLFYSKKLVIATGGASYPQITGVSDVGLKIAHSFGHDVIPFKPALVGLTLQKDQFWMKELSGISIFANIKYKGLVLHGDILFAHRGISGPVVLNTSLYWDGGNIVLDFLPNVDIEKIFKLNQKKQLSTALPLPKRFSKLFLQSINFDDVKVETLIKEKKLTLINLLHNYTFSPAGNFGFKKAEVSLGGVNTQMIDNFSMQSKICEGLFFVGEILNVTGRLGGYNIHWAFCSALTCSSFLNKN